MRLLLVRHGETPTNIERLLDTRCPGPGLTDLGRKQTSQVVEALRDVPINAIYASTFHRTQLTAAPLAEANGLIVEVRDGLKEVLAGDLEMRGRDEDFAAYLGVLMSWISGDEGRRMPGAETGAEFMQRFDEVVDEIERMGYGTAVVFSHGGSIRVWSTRRAENLDPDFARLNRIPNGAVIELVGSTDSGWRAVSWAGIRLDTDERTMVVSSELDPEPSGSRLV